MKLSIFATLSLLAFVLADVAAAAAAVPSALPSAVPTAVPSAVPSTAPSTPAVPAAGAPSLPAGISAWPVSDKPPPAVPAALLSKWPLPGNITTTVRGLTACDAAHTTCSWTCTQCLGPEDLYQCPDKTQWGVTFDDGPTTFTPALLDFLKTKNIKATFFVIGARVVEFPDTLRRAYAEGHHIAVHTWSHTMLTSQTNDIVLAELWYTAAAINATIGVWPQYMRPPYGDIDDRVRALVKSLGMVPTLWVDDTNDWELGEVQTTTNFTPESITAEVQSWIAKKNSTAFGPITLEHDLYKQSTDLAINSVVPLMAAAWTPVPVFKCAGPNATAPYFGVTTVTTALNATVSSVAPIASASAPAVSAVPSVQPKATSSAAGLRVSAWIAPAAVMLAAWL